MNEHKTAITRTKASKPAMDLAVNPILLEGIPKFARVLDYGCGKGADLDFWREGISLGAYSSNFEVVGYDKYQEGHTLAPEGLFDLVTLFYVLNVIDDPLTRQATVGLAASFVKPGGLLAIAARDEADIRQARTSLWEVEGDGYRTGTGTFQCSVSEQQLIYYGALYGLTVESEMGSGYSGVVFTA